MKIIILLGLCWSWSFLIHAQPSTTTGDWKEKIDPLLIDDIAANKEAGFLIVFRQQADVSGAAAITGKEAKGNYVFGQLKQVAKTSQKLLVDWLKNRRLHFRPFFIVNAVYVQGNASLIPQIAQREEVSWVAADPSVSLEYPLDETWEVDLRNTRGWGLDAIHAPDVWALGFTGQGVVVGGQDTGYEWDHPAIKNQYRGWNGSSVNHHYNWHDAIHSLNPLNMDSIATPDRNPCGLDAVSPCDDDNHGTHTMGIMVGKDANSYETGVAPGARWIGCRNMDRGWGTPSTYLECFEWFLAPTDLEGKNPDPGKAPHVINNSWSCPELEGCTPANWGLMDQAIINLKAAGTVVVVSAGNNGGGCATVSNPPAIFENSFSIGATQIGDTIASFSSRGPVQVDESGRLKPDVSAPGRSILSAVRNGAYRSFSGTSMAGPHVAGLVALILSANPGLAGEVEAIETIIEETAVMLPTGQECSSVPGSSRPNFTYGHGRIDALAAVEKALAGLNNIRAPDRNSLVKVYPNPFSGSLAFRFDQLTGEVEVHLLDISARRMDRVQWQVQNGEEKRIDWTSLPAGIYFYQIIHQKSVTGGKIVKW